MKKVLLAGLASVAVALPLAAALTKGDTAPTFTARASLAGKEFNYSMAEREAERRLLPACAEAGVAVLVNRPYSAANGLARTSTDSTLWAGRSRSKSPVEGSIKLALLTCSAPVVG